MFIRKQNRLEFSDRLDEKSEGKGNSYFSISAHWKGDGTTCLYRKWGSGEDRFGRQRRGGERERRKLKFIHKLEVPVGHLKQASG